MNLDILRPIIGIEDRTAIEVYDIMCDRIRSLTIAQPAGVRVKPLKWVFDYIRGNVWYGNSVIPPHYRASGNVWWRVGEEGKRLICDNLEQAKDAAQADYASRILSSLEETP